MYLLNRGFETSAARSTMFMSSSLRRQVRLRDIHALRFKLYSPMVRSSIGRRSLR